MKDRHGKDHWKNEADAAGRFTKAGWIRSG
jgi:hypothetical protein